MATSFPILPRITRRRRARRYLKGISVMGVRTLCVRPLLAFVIAVASSLPIASTIFAKNPGAKSQETVLQSLTVFPAKITLDGPRDEQRLVVMGEYSDRTRKDLTRKTKFSSTAVKTATMDPNGIVHPDGDGDGAIMIHAE